MSDRLPSARHRLHEGAIRREVSRMADETETALDTGIRTRLTPPEDVSARAIVDEVCRRGRYRLAVGDERKADGAEFQFVPTEDDRWASPASAPLLQPTTRPLPTTPPCARCRALPALLERSALPCLPPPHVAPGCACNCCPAVAPVEGWELDGGALAAVRALLPVWARHVNLDDLNGLARVLLEVGRELGRVETEARAAVSRDAGDVSDELALAAAGHASSALDVDDLPKGDDLALAQQALAEPDPRHAVFTWDLLVRAFVAGAKWHARKVRT